MIKSIMISSGSNPTAYLMSLFEPYSGYLCSGNQVLAFNPLTVTSNAIWAKKTDSCKWHSGITFGRDENIIYAYSY